MALSENPSSLGFVGDLQALATSLPVPTYQTLYRTGKGQLVVANLKPLGQLGWEAHKFDQHTTVQQGQALVVLKKGQKQGLRKPWIMGGLL